MTGHLPSTSSEYRRNSGPSVGAISIVFVALLVLFLWMSFVLAQQIESTGRDIQEKTEELRALERKRDALLMAISAAGSEQSMSDQASVLGYGPQTPIYLPLAQPLAQTTTAPAAQGGAVATPVGADGQAAGASLWDLLVGQAHSVEPDAAP